MEQNNEPEAIDVANQLENGFITLGKTARALRYEAAETIRRLHARVQELESMLDAVGAGGVSAQRVTQDKDHIAQGRKMVVAQEPLGYFKAEPFGWRDCAETDEGAIALYEAPQPQADERDAQRYRWLRSQPLESDVFCITIWRKGTDGFGDDLRLEKLDDAIDAAITKATGRADSADGGQKEKQ